MPENKMLIKRVTVTEEFEPDDMGVDHDLDAEDIDDVGPDDVDEQPRPAARRRTR